MKQSPDPIEPFYAVEINRLAHQRVRRGLPVIHMEVGQPSLGAPDAAIEVGLRALRERPQDYWESGALKERIAAFYRERYEIDLDPARVVLSMGASGALLLALAGCFRPGQRLALARPGYPAHRNSMRAFGLEPVELDCGPEQRFQPTAGLLAALDPAPDGLVLTSPSNPTGSMIDDDELVRLAAVCRARGIRIISDETYHGITYDRPARTILGLDDKALVINTFSKFWCMTGWRLGWAVVPAAMAETMGRYADNLFLVPPTLAQHVALAAMEETAELEQRVAAYAHNRKLLTEGLPKLGIRDFAPVDGAFYVYADVGHLTDDSLEFCKRLLAATGLALNTGRDFDTVNGNRFIRFSFAVSAKETEQALELLGGWLAREQVA